MSTVEETTMSDGKPPDFAALAEQILAYTKVDVNPKDPDPGQAMTVETVTMHIFILRCQAMGRLRELSTRSGKQPSCQKGTA